MWSRITAAVKGLLALLIIAALAVGVPVVLASQGVPFADAVDTFSDELSSDAKRIETVLLGGLTTLGWTAWLQVMASLINDVVARIRGRMPNHLPVIPGVQVLVQRLVGSVALAASLLTAASPAAATVTTPPEPLTVFQDEAPESPTPPQPSTTAPDADPASPAMADVETGTLTHHVVPGDTLWDLSVTLLGDGMRWKEIADLNRGTTMADGALFNPEFLRPGWTLRVPAESAPQPADPAAGVVHEVERGDTLWDISTEYLGEGERYTEIAEANPEITDPNLIFPGQQLTITPAPTATTLTAEDTDIAPPVQVDAPSPPVEAERHPPEPADVVEDAQDVEAPTPAPVEHAPPSTPAEVLPPPANTNVPVEQAGDDTRDAVVGQSGSLVSVPAGLAVGGLVTAGVVGVIDRRRRARRKERQRGRVAPVPDDRVEIAELALRAGAHIDRAHYLAAALKSAAAELVTGLPALSWVGVDDHGVTLALTGDPGTSPPRGWFADGESWRTTETYDTLVDRGGGRLDPLPALCPVGTLPDGTEVLIDLEAAGIVTIRGDRDGQSGLIRAMAMNATTAVWSNSPRILLAGFEGEITHMPNVETVDLATTGIEEAVAQAKSTRQALEDVGCRSIVQARMSGATPDVWEPVMVLSAHPTGETHFQAAQGVLPSESLAAAVVTISEHHCDSGVTLTVTTDGDLQADLLPAGVRASYLHEDDIVRLGEILNHAALPATEPAPPAVRTRPATTALEAPETGSGRDVLGEMKQSFDVIVRIMGHVRVEDTHGAPVNFERRKPEEAVVCLASFGGEADIETLEAKLWPAGTNSDGTRANAMTFARNALGAGRDHEPLFPKPAKGGRYKLSSRVTTDFDLFLWLVELSRETDDPLASARLLDQALTLVDGEPFLGSGRSYAWTASCVGAVVTNVVDAAYVAGEIFLHAGDPAATERVCRAGLKCSPTEEMLYRLLMQASHKAGSTAGVTRLFRELEEILADPDAGTEPDASISPDTISLYESLLTSA